MNPVQIQPGAALDSEQAAFWYERQLPGLGTQFVLELDAAIERAASSPESYEDLYRGVRRVLLRRFPYAAYFVFADGGVQVLAILHQHRDPKTWKDRLSK